MMTKRYFFILLSFYGLFIPRVFSQNGKVGLVLSGGGSKGLAHIGVIKALEEHHIPIDYVVGTSMGGVIGGFYAAGYSAEEIETIALSPAFQDWINGNIPEEYTYFFPKSDIDPSVLKVGLDVRSNLQAVFSTYLANDLSLNFAMEEHLAIANQLSGGNFDSLFVPFRTTAAEVFMQKELVLHSGSLSSAVRATMTVPMVYRPIKLNNQYVFDGGIYNNFPVDIMKKEFSPEVVIGINVSDKNFSSYPENKIEELLPQVLFYALVSKSNTQLGTNDVFIEPNVADISALDFTKPRETIDSGYYATLSHLPEIRKKVYKRISRTHLIQKRNSFFKDSTTVNINQINVKGLNNYQEHYLRNYFIQGDQRSALADIKEGYFKLAAEDYFKEIIPKLHHNPIDSSYQMEIVAKSANKARLRLGGMAASRGIGYLYFGLDYTNLQRQLNKIDVSVATGGFYKSLDLSLRSFFPGKQKFYLEPKLVLNNWDYLDTEDFLSSQEELVILERRDRYLGLEAGFPIGNQFKLAVENAYIDNKDKFSNLSILDPSAILDQLVFRGYKTGLRLSANKLNRRQYPSMGRSIDIGLHYITGKERYEGGTTSLIEGQQSHHRSWFRLYGKSEKYTHTNNFSFGRAFKFQMSNLPIFSNYFSTLLYTGESDFLPESPTLFYPSFRANSFVSVELKGVWEVRKNIDFRLEAMVFNKLASIKETNSQMAEIAINFWDPAYAASSSLVFHSPIGPISARLNYFEGRKRPLHFLFHVGYILFNQRSFN